MREYLRASKSAHHQRPQPSSDRHGGCPPERPKTRSSLKAPVAEGILRATGRAAQGSPMAALKSIRQAAPALWPSPRSAQPSWFGPGPRTWLGGSRTPCPQPPYRNPPLAPLARLLPFGGRRVLTSASPIAVHRPVGAVRSRLGAIVCCCAQHACRLDQRQGQPQGTCAPKLGLPTPSPQACLDAPSPQR